MRNEKLYEMLNNLLDVVEHYLQSKDCEDLRLIIETLLDLCKADSGDVVDNEDENDGYENDVQCEPITKTRTIETHRISFTIDWNYVIIEIIPNRLQSSMEIKFEYNPHAVHRLTISLRYSQSIAYRKYAPLAEEELSFSIAENQTYPEYEILDYEYSYRVDGITILKDYHEAENIQSGRPTMEMLFKICDIVNNMVDRIAGEQHSSS